MFSFWAFCRQVQWYNASAEIVWFLYCDHVTEDDINILLLLVIVHYVNTAAYHTSIMY